MDKKTLRVKGLSCTDCAARIQAGVARIDGVHSSVVDVNTGQLVVFLEGHDLPLGEIERVVRQTGHELEADGTGGRAAGRQVEGGALLGFARFILSRPETTRTAAAGLLILVGLAVALIGRYATGTALHVTSTILFAAAIAVGGFSLARYAFQELWLSRRLGINALMVIAVSGAMLIGQWAEAAIVVVLFSLGEALESYATDRARRALDGLLDLSPPTAHRLLASGETEEVRVEQLAIGERVLVRAGDRVSVDGIVRAGLSAVDQAPITGESVPVEKSPDDQVFAGTINTSGVLEVEVTHLAADSTLSRMVRLVKQAQAQQAPVQRFIDRFARVYTPAVAVAALLVAALPPLLLGQPFWGTHGWLMRALQMLVIACPCALVISTPVSLVSAMTNAAARGVLIKGGRHLEALSRVRVFAFDKTGTLTQGKPMVTDVVSVCDCGRCNDTCGLEYASALEIQSSHPIARAVVAAAGDRQVAIQRADEVRELGGRGIEGSVGGVQVTVGSHSHFDAHIPHREDVCTLANDLSGQGKTPILVCHDGEVCSLLGVADTPRHESAEVIDALKSAGGVHTVMLTGDHPVVAEAIGRQVGVDEVRAALLPEDKMSAIAALAAKYGLVAMVGDGVNDAPALAQADVGIAMGGAGSAQAMETADVVLMGDDLAQLPFIVRLSKRTRSTITGNIVFALAIKAVVFGLAAAGVASLWMAIVADVGASLAVILNGMRLRRVG